MTIKKDTDHYKIIYWLCFSGVFFLLDQSSKWVAVHELSLYEQVNIFPFFSWCLMYNTGAAFSFLGGENGWQRWFLIGIAFIVITLLIFWLKRLRLESSWQSFAVALIIGGALGNVCDRIMTGHVVDFISFHYHQYYFPAFNLADSGITVGALLLIFNSFFQSQVDK